MAKALPGFERIVVDSQVLNGVPCVRGTRISVVRILDILASNPSWDDLREDYPALEPEDIRQVLTFASSQMTDRFIPLASK